MMRAEVGLHCSHHFHSIPTFTQESTHAPPLMDWMLRRCL
jgi:hypothetical protein